MIQNSDFKLKSKRKQQRRTQAPSEERCVQVSERMKSVVNFKLLKSRMVQTAPVAPEAKCRLPRALRLRGRKGGGWKGCEGKRKVNRTVLRLIAKPAGANLKNDRSGEGRKEENSAARTKKKLAELVCTQHESKALATSDDNPHLSSQVRSENISERRRSIRDNNAL